MHEFVLNVISPERGSEWGKERRENRERERERDMVRNREYNNSEVLVGAIIHRQQYR